MYIYKTTNRINGKIYIGLCEKSVELSKDYLGSGDSFKKALSKYGKKNFHKEILEDNIESREILAKSEIFWISEFNSSNRDIGYNLSPGGDLNPDRMKKGIYKYSRDGDLLEYYPCIDKAKIKNSIKNSDLYKVKIRDNKPIKGFWWSLEYHKKEFIIEKDLIYKKEKSKKMVNGANKRYSDPDELEKQKNHMREIRKMVTNFSRSDECKEKISKEIRGRKCYINNITGEKKQTKEKPNGDEWIQASERKFL